MSRLGWRGNNGSKAEWPFGPFLFEPKPTKGEHHGPSSRISKAQHQAREEGKASQQAPLEKVGHEGVVVTKENRSGYVNALSTARPAERRHLEERRSCSLTPRWSNTSIARTSQSNPSSLGPVVTGRSRNVCRVSSDRRRVEQGCAGNRRSADETCLASAADTHFTATASQLKTN